MHEEKGKQADNNTANVAVALVEIHHKRSPDKLFHFMGIFIFSIT